MSQIPECASLRSVVEERIDRWHDGAEPDALQMLAEHPELSGSKSLVMDLALEEYSLRRAGGEAIAKSEFCDRFPEYRRSIARLLEVEDEFLDRCPPEEKEAGAQWPLPGDELLGYEIVEPLGRGGLARVFLARERDVGGRYVVIKVSLFDDREAHALGKLSHPGIVPIHSVQQEPERGLTVICMPLAGVATAIDLLDAAFAAGERPQDGAVIARVARETAPLTTVSRPAVCDADLYENRPYSEAIARIGLELAEALAAAHAAGIQHRDIKPSNILLAWSGRPMLLDFNLSVDAAAAANRVGGTLAYMAPELIEGLIEGDAAAVRRFEPRADVYSLGVVLYELLTGRLPAKPLIAERLLATDYESWLECKRQPIACERGLDAGLERIVRKCLSVEPAERYATAAELATALRSYLAKYGVAARRTRQRRWIVALGAVAIVSGAGGVVSYYATRPPQVEVLYKQALAEYAEEEYEKAAETFTKCMQLRPGWPNAIFGRAQSLRQLERWDEARTDYMALEPWDRAWAFALAGYCNMRLRHFRPAAEDFQQAYAYGLRDIGFLLNYANSLVLRQAPAQAIPIYSEVLQIDGNNKAAIRNRGTAYSDAVVSTNSLPNEQAFDDAKKYCELEPTSFEAPMCAANIFGEAARKDSRYKVEAANYLQEALAKGMPIQWVSGPILGPLLPEVDEDIRARARSKKPKEHIDPRPPNDPPATAEWKKFEKEVGIPPRPRQVGIEALIN